MEMYVIKIDFNIQWIILLYVKYCQILGLVSVPGPCGDHVETLPLTDITSHPVPSEPPTPSGSSPDTAANEKRQQYQSVRLCAGKGEESIFYRVDSSTGEAVKTNVEEKKPEEKMPEEKMPKEKDKKKASEFTESENEVLQELGVQRCSKPFKKKK